MCYSPKTRSPTHVALFANRRLPEIVLASRLVNLPRRIVSLHVYYFRKASSLNHAAIFTSRRFTLSQFFPNTIAKIHSSSARNCRTHNTKSSNIVVEVYCLSAQICCSQIPIFTNMVAEMSCLSVRVCSLQNYYLHSHGCRSVLFIGTNLMLTEILNSPTWLTK